MILYYLLKVFIIRSKDILNGNDTSVCNTSAVHQLETYSFEHNHQSLTARLRNKNYQTKSLLPTPLSDMSICHIMPTYSSKHEIIRQYSYRKLFTKQYQMIHRHDLIPIKQCKLE